MKHRGHRLYRQKTHLKIQAEKRQLPLLCTFVQSCGAQIVTDETTAALFCYYCHNPVVLEEKLAGNFKPDYILPFQIDKKKAQEIFTQWVGRKKFVPDYFFSPPDREHDRCIFRIGFTARKVKGDLQAEGKTVRTWEIRRYALYRNESL